MISSNLCCIQYKPEIGKECCSMTFPSRQEFSPSQSSTAEMTLDTSLTSLSWLLNLRVLDLVTPDVSGNIPISPIGEDNKFSPTKECTSPVPSVGVSLTPIKKCLIQCAQFSSAPRKYRTDSRKPPFTHTTLIYLAIKHSRAGRVTLTDVIKWIRVNFKFYRTTDPDSSWENSIQHNLFHNDLFIKVPYATSKGSYWRINPEYSQTLNEANSTHPNSAMAVGRKRALSHDITRVNNMRKRRIKSESAGPADPCGLPGDLNWVSLLSSQRLGCASCPCSQACRPSFGSPVLGTPDLGHIGEPIVCSPLVVGGTTELAEIPASSAVADVSNGALLEEAVLKQDSPPMGLLPWNESQSQSPTNPHLHPWAESKEKTLHELHNMSKTTETVSTYFQTTTTWSPESSWSSSSTYSAAGIKKQAPLLSKAYTC